MSSGLVRLTLRRPIADLEVGLQGLQLGHERPEHLQAVRSDIATFDRGGHTAAGFRTVGAVDEPALLGERRKVGEGGLESVVG